MRGYTYDVFLSFRGEDTRDNFTDHLYSALCRKGIKTFIDNKLDRGEEISDALLKAIEESRISIVVFSKTYASSKWCLDELVKILQCKKSKNQMVRPVFYKVDPSNVRNQSGSFGEALAQHERRFNNKTERVLSWIRNLLNWSLSYDDSEFKHNMKKLNKWTKALKEAADLSGWTYSNGSESKFIDNIVEEISEQILRHSNFNVADHPVGIHSRVRDMHNVLGLGVKDVRMVGIWGMGGIGKTTIARAVYNSLAYKFDGSCFLENVGKESMQHGGLVRLQSYLLYKILGGQKLKLTDVGEGMSAIQDRLLKKRVLLVLDDVNQLDQLKKLCGSFEWFGIGSRIIITTRNKHLLTTHQVKRIHTIKELDHQEALELFIANAFPRERLPVDYSQLASDAVHYAQGLPSALIALGSVLCGRPIKEWQEELNTPFYSLQSGYFETLRISYNNLEDSVKNVFLDIAFFFNGQDENHVLQILEGGDKPNKSISELKEKALIRINEKNHILMHNILEVMAKEIVHIESPKNPARRSRLWFSDDVYDVLTRCTGTDNIKGVMVMFGGPHEIALQNKSFEGMTNLQFFINTDAHFSGDIEYLPDKLTLIDWPEFPFGSFPINFNPTKLVKLSIPRSLISQLGETFKSCSNLKYINLESCHFLTRIPDLSGFPNLKELNLNNCTSLVEVDQSVGLLDKLVILSLSGCDRLTRFPRRIALISVKYINLGGCRLLETFCDILENVVSLTRLDLSGTAIEELPETVIYLVSLKHLILRQCDKLIHLPHSIYDLHSLSRLDLQNCSKLVTLPRWNDEQSVSTNLRFLDLRGCTELSEIPELPPSMEWINADGCESLVRVAKLSNILERRASQMIESISLYNCQRLCDNLPHCGAGNKSSLFSLIHLAKQSEFEIVFPASEVPSWFRNRKYLMELFDECEFSFEIPLNFNKGLAICASATAVGNLDQCSFTASIHINGESRCTYSFCFEASKMKDSAHVWLLYIPFVKFAFHEPPYSCLVNLKHTSKDSVRCRSYGVHLVMLQDEYEDFVDDSDLEDEYSAGENDEDMIDQIEDGEDLENIRPKKRRR
ncbi:disease resistance protein RPV1-like [Rosa rugosa]|uniref:disease resistance protein RPV1-like n=1 Tax=Rosa rugosa TaxID=74645 RepID=UPI002B4102DD|nr:disease resistance protein RPV1-like [Rosa rugosa]